MQKKNIGKSIFAVSALSVSAAVIYLIISSPKMEPAKVNKERYLTGSMYIIFGMLDEYNGRFDLSGQPLPNFVESFSEAEKETADYFDGCIKSYKKESGLDFKFVRTNNGHVFESKELSDIINSFYIMADHIAVLDSSIIRKASLENKLNYIYGVYKRFGDADKNSITMANAFKKLETAAFALKELKCSNIYIFRSRRAVPVSGKVIFMPSAVVGERLQIQQIITESDILKEGFYHIHLKMN